RPERVIHLASAVGEEPDALFDVDIAGAFSILEACRHHLDRLGGDSFRLVHALRAGSGTRREAASKAARALIEAFARTHGLPAIACAADEAFGPWQAADTLIPGLIGSLLSGGTWELASGGAPARDWLLVSDFADGLLRAAEKGEAFARYEFS